MKVDVSTDGFKKQLSIVVPREQVNDRLNAEYKRLAGKVRLQGFRPGKAPRNVLEARFGPRVEADVKNELIQQGYRSAITEHGIQPVSEPSLATAGDIDAADGFQFTITVDVRPDVTLTKYTGLDVVNPKVEVGKDEIDARVTARIEGEAKLTEVTDRPLARGDMALVELEATDAEGNVVANEPGTMIRTEDDPYFPGLEALLDGMAIGDERSGEIAFAAASRTEDIAGKTLQVRVKLLSVQARELPAVTDELATSLGYEGGVAGMRAALEQQLREVREEAARNQARANLLESLIAVNPFDVPQSMIESSLKMLLEEMKLQTAIRTGRDPRTIGFSDAQVQDLRNRARFAARAALILEAVAKAENLAVTDADVDKKYAELADQRGQSVEAVRGWFGKEDAVQELRDRILEENTLDWLLERANLVDAPVSSPA
jgi:trigger factor